MLRTGDPLGTVVTMLATPFSRLDGLAIDTAGAGGWLPTGSPPDSTSEGVIDGLPGSVSLPRRKVVVDGPPWGKIVGQRSPDTAIAVAVEDGINHGPHLGLAWPPTGAGRRQEGLQDSPLLACQITGVWLRVHTLSTFETPPFGTDSERLRRLLVAVKVLAPTAPGGFSREITPLPGVLRVRSQCTKAGQIAAGHFGRTADHANPPKRRMSLPQKRLKVPARSCR